MAVAKMQLRHGVFVVIIGIIWCFNISYLDGEFQRASMASRQQPAQPQQKDPHCGPTFAVREAPPASSLQNYDKKRQRAESATTPSLQSANTTTAAKDFHIVFSTGCNAYQDWQSYVFFYQAWRSGQRGRVTRVASGCKSAAAAQQLRDTFQKQIVVAMMNNDSDRFSLHITPDYSTLIDGLKYKFFNKPYGILHWLEEGLQFPMKLPMHDDTIIVIMDPDQFLLRPLREDYTDDDTMKWHGPSPHLHDGTNNVIRIQKGRPFAQWYAVGVHFVSQINVNVEAVVQAANYTADWGPSHLHNWTEDQVRQYYAAGPPYLAVASDMYDLVKTWAEMAGPVYQLTTDHLSEMYAYATAAAHLNLPHQLSTSFMVSDPDIGPRLGGGGEDWTVIDTAPPGQVCELAHDDHWIATVPPIIHYCQRYRVGPYAFSKYRLPRRFLSCDRPLIQDPHHTAVERGGDSGNSETIGDLVTRYNETDMLRPSDVGEHRHVVQSQLQQRQRHAYMLCQTIRTVNAALTYWKQNHCNNGGVVPMAKLHKTPGVMTGWST